MTKFDIGAINPKRHPKYSPNLYKWIRNQMRKRCGEPVIIQRDEIMDGDKALHVAFRSSDGFYYGARLLSILRNGAREKTWAYGRNEVEVPDFWPRYIAHGRCAIDSEHKKHFIGDETRWEQINANTRRCAWCGNRTQHLRKRVVRKTVAEWINGQPQQEGS